MSSDLLKAPSPLRILLIESDLASGNTIQRFLKQSGMRVTWARSGADAIGLKRASVPDVVLIDPSLQELGLPKPGLPEPGAPVPGGVSLINWLERQNDCGIIVVSGQAEEAAQVAGLELGADDYVAKPPQLRELVARIRAVHRRMARSRTTRHPGGTKPPATATANYRIGPYRFDNPSHSVIGPGNEAVALTGAEFIVLQMLLEAFGQPVSRSLLFVAALRRPWRPEDRSIDQLVFQLRRKLAFADTGDRMIQAVRGAGYLLALEPPAVRQDLPQ